jgi:hypothetical protein
MPHGISLFYLDCYNIGITKAADYSFTKDFIELKEQFIIFHNICFAAPMNIVNDFRFTIKFTNFPSRT